MNKADKLFKRLLQVVAYAVVPAGIMFAAWIFSPALLGVLLLVEMLAMTLLEGAYYREDRDRYLKQFKR